MALERLAHYEILERMGDSFVFKARDSRDGAIVAIKVLPAWMRSNEALSRFEREIEVERAISHPNLTNLHEVGETEVDDVELVGSASNDQGKATVLYLAREYVDGDSLQTALEQRALPLALALSITMQVAEGLLALHNSNIIHRNINPNNVHLTAKGEVKLVDFGLVKILKDKIAASEAQRFQTATGQLIGTAPFLSPEQIRGEDVDARTDLFAVGALLYRMLTGTTPFPADNLLQYFHAIEEEEPRPMSQFAEDVPPELDRIVRKSLEKDRAQRYQNARELIDDLQRFLESPEV